MKVFFETEFGSRLYGTATPTSDFDRKAIYIPAVQELLLLKKPEIFKERFDHLGNKLRPNGPMPEGGVETEFIPLQKFAFGFLGGQAYALEVAHGVLSQPNLQPEVRNFLEELIKKFSHSSVAAMVGFAEKQTFDYVDRAVRLQKATQVLNLLSKIEALQPAAKLSDIWSGTKQPIIDFVANELNLETRVYVNHGRSFRALELNGRSYIELTKVSLLIDLQEAAVEKYGRRVTEAMGNQIEWKSLSHAVRIYEQAIELLQTHKITLPRPNAAELLKIKQGLVEIEVVRDRLSYLRAILSEAMKTTTLPPNTSFEPEFEGWLLSKLNDIYFG